MQIRNISAFTEACLDLQFNSAKRGETKARKDGIACGVEAECHRVIWLFSSSDCSEGRESWT